MKNENSEADANTIGGFKDGELTSLKVHCLIEFSAPLSGVYTGVKTIKNCHRQLQFETELSILKLHR